MTAKKGKKYAPPKVMDLHTNTAQGQENPEGMCTAGNLPWGVNCVAGPTFGSFVCNAGSNGSGSNCSTGPTHFTPYCNVGSLAQTTCAAGTGA